MDECMHCIMAGVNGAQQGQMRHSNKAITSLNDAVIVFHYGDDKCLRLLFSHAHRVVPAR